LFAAGRPLAPDVIASYSKMRLENVIVALQRLSESYKDLGSAIEIVPISSNKFVMQVGKEYAKYAIKASSGSPLTLGARKTLAVIAYKQPIPQSTLIKIRGAHSYRYVKELIRIGYVKGDKLGKTKLLRTTQVFNDLFGMKDEEQIRALIGTMLEGKEKSGSKEDSKKAV